MCHSRTFRLCVIWISKIYFWLTKPNTFHGGSEFERAHTINNCFYMCSVHISFLYMYLFNNFFFILKFFIPSLFVYLYTLLHMRCACIEAMNVYSCLLYFPFVSFWLGFVVVDFSSMWMCRSRYLTTSLKIAVVVVSIFYVSYIFFFFIFFLRFLCFAMWLLDRNIFHLTHICCQLFFSHFPPSNLLPFFCFLVSLVLFFSFLFSVCCFCVGSFFLALAILYF